MSLFEIEIIQKDSSRKTVADRPLHKAGDAHAIVYKGKKWVVDARLRVDLRKAKPLGEEIQTRLATPAEVAVFIQGRRRKGTRERSDVSGPASAAENPSATPLLVVVPAADPGVEDFDASQKAVIEDEATARQLVDAGPGSGKTAVVCARAAWLGGTAHVSPSGIWVISFTRTAVREIRDRIGRLLPRNIANAIQVATLDSMTGQINAGFGLGREGRRSFDDAIRNLHGALAENQAVQDYLRQLKHVIIDEAQDIVGVRADLLMSLIGQLPTDCGVTVLSDDAQAIYGFATGDDNGPTGENAPKPALPGRIRSSNLGRSFTTRTLAELHRTSDPRLKAIFTEVRLEVLESGVDPAKRHRSIRKRLMDLAHAPASTDIRQTVRGLPDDSFVLFRRRVEVLRASNILRRSGIPHRVRMSGLPPTVEPWVGLALGEAKEPRIGQVSFVSRWSERVEGTAHATISPDDAFRVLLRLAPDSAGKMIDMALLRRKLADRPPPELARPELGAAGPIVGTIHASKGREAASVTLMMPGLSHDQLDGPEIDEETRVLFVAATRSRQQLRIAEVSPFSASQADSGRVYQFQAWNSDHWCSIELGRIGDITPVGVAGRNWFENAGTVRRNQEMLLKLAGAPVDIELYKRRIGENWAFCLCTGYGEEPLAVLSRDVDSSILDATCRGLQHFKLAGAPKPPLKIGNLRLVGLTTLALRPDDPRTGELLDPWRTSGLMLAPLVQGFPRFKLKTK